MLARFRQFLPWHFRNTAVGWARPTPPWRVVSGLFGSFASPWRSGTKRDDRASLPLPAGGAHPAGLGRFLPAMLLIAACSADPAVRASENGGTEAGHASPTESTNDDIRQLLDELEARGRQLRSLQAKVVYTTEQGLLGDSQTRIGEVTYQATAHEPRGDAARSAASEPAEDAADPTRDRTIRFHVHFTHLAMGRGLREHDRKYIFDGTWLAEVHVEQKQFIRNQVVAPGEPYDPLALGEGPFPLPLGQERQRVMAMFEVTRRDTDSDDVIHLRLDPKTDPRTGEPFSEFDRVDLWYDAGSLLPTKVVTREGKGADATVTTVELREVAVDQLDADRAGQLFDTTPPDRGTGWEVQIKPLEG